MWASKISLALSNSLEIERSIMVFICLKIDYTNTGDQNVAMVIEVLDLLLEELSIHGFFL